MPGNSRSPPFPSKKQSLLLLHFLKMVSWGGGATKCERHVRFCPEKVALISEGQIWTFFLILITVKKMFSGIMSEVRKDK